MLHGIHGNVVNDSRNMSMEAMKAKLLKEVESANVSVKKMSSDLSIMNQLMDSLYTTIKNLEYQMS